MARNTGKRPHELALEILKPGVTLTPTEIEKHVGNGPYASKHIWFLRKLGHDITVNKEGRTVLSYTYNGMGTAQPAAPKKAKPAKAAKPMSRAEERRQTAAKKAIDKTEETFGSTGAVKSYSVDPDWDAVEGDVKALL